MCMSILAFFLSILSHLFSSCPFFLHRMTISCNYLPLNAYSRRTKRVRGDGRGWEMVFLYLPKFGVFLGTLFEFLACFLIALISDSFLVGWAREMRHGCWMTSERCMSCSFG
ncbi:hypothetical protein BU24DRAFT_67417 [Aaosphaeria arxii CBS 175.79]|uniref:Uncharacterized protein n=1 Tax=Aaosphaeria arxii CBS 175.79 TaxID=1450172 RepID=A0A6A5XAE9_9PLEO|nr:uncharacterized protein BU24DRAFT_67417 [Aaosphaeria arxii CBS 175.79]KAF2009921.1 hypothetical protein BU24DRAFT_67417 [Aaosphaeria arxii CBS 175.79]